MMKVQLKDQNLLLLTGMQRDCGQLIAELDSEYDEWWKTLVYRMSRKIFSDLFEIVTKMLSQRYATLGDICIYTLSLCKIGPLCLVCLIVDKVFRR